MRVTTIAAACLIVAGCANEKVETAEAPPPPPPPELTRADCYTVVLFDDPPVIEPSPEVPEEYSKYLGSWTRGAWDGKWCTELYVTEVQPDGLVELYEMHAPYEEWGQPASAFKRTARIDNKGDLRFRYGTESVLYRLVEGTLHAERSGRFGKLAAVLVTPEAEVPDAAETVQVAMRDPAEVAATATVVTEPPAEAAVVPPAEQPAIEILPEVPAGGLNFGLPSEAPAEAASVAIAPSAG